MDETKAASVLLKEIPKIFNQFILEMRTSETLRSIENEVSILMYGTEYWDVSKANFNPVIPGANLEVRYNRCGVEVTVRFPNVDNLQFNTA